MCSSLSHPVRAARPLTQALLLVLVLAAPVFAQNWSTDARSVALGSGGTEIAAFKMTQEERPYRTIVIPLGLIQLVPRWSVFNPSGEDFDPARAIAFAASPLHYKLGATTSGDSPQGLFIKNIVNAEFSRDLNTYRGFRPPSSFNAEGLASPNWGKTFVVAGKRDGAFQGVYVGGGPYFTVKTAGRFDARLIEFLGSDTEVFMPHTSFAIDDVTTAQLALAVTGGYRARFALPRGAAAPRDGLYVAADYHYLRGFRYEDVGMDLRFDTDGAGLLDVAPTTQPIAVNRLTSGRGTGMAVDVSVAMVTGGWEFGFGANGLGNQITWQEIERQGFVLTSLFDGGDFIELTFPGVEPSRRVEQPVEYSGNAAYSSGPWSVQSQFSQGYRGRKFRGGAEVRLGAIDLRGGLRLSEDHWHPTAGVGWNLTPTFGVDVAVFATSANLEKRRDAAVAVSLRLTR